MKQVIFLMTMVLMLFSCKTYKLSKSDLEWQPYKIGDKLVFESNKGELDTIKVENIEVHTGADDPLAVLPNKIQTLFVSGLYYHKPKKDIMGRMFNTTFCNVIEMRANSSGSFIEFTIRLGENELKYPSVVQRIKEMNKLNVDENGRYVIEAKEYYDNMKDRPFDLRYIYWSKEYGYLGLEFKDNYIWALKSFIRDGKEIL